MMVLLLLNSNYQLGQQTRAPDETQPVSQQIQNMGNL